jgi:hypothetical protein
MFDPAMRDTCGTDAQHLDPRTAPIAPLTRHAEADRRSATCDLALRNGRACPHDRPPRERLRQRSLLKFGGVEAWRAANLRADLTTRLAVKDRLEKSKHLKLLETQLGWRVALF